ncbi:DNA (cytosine-5-)-methyltransferase [Mycoplasma sp. AC157]
MPSALSLSLSEETPSFYNDIKEVKVIPNGIDIFTYSFPCQDLSQQGKQKGITKETRSGLLLQIQRLLIANKDRLPKVLLLENVKSLASKKFNDDFNKWIDFLKSLGYFSTWKIINSSDFNSVQNRERVFMISTLNKNGFEWPEIIKNTKKLNKIIKEDTEQTPKDKLLEDKLKKLKIDEFYVTKNNIKKAFIHNYTNFNSENYIYANTHLGPTLTASGANSRIKFFFENTKKIRVINGEESLLYMGFSKEDIKKIKDSNLLSEQKMTFLAGNSISVEVLEKIFEKIVEFIKENYE